MSEETETRCECGVEREECPWHLMDGTPSERRRGWVYLAIVAVVWVAILSWASSADAQSPTATTSPMTSTSADDGTEVGDTVSLARGDRAPWDGELVRSDDLFDLQRVGFETRFRLDAEHQLRLDAASAHDREMAAAATACAERIDLRTGLWEARARELSQQVADARSHQGAAWYESLGAGLVGAAIGIVVGIVAAVVVAISVR